MKLTKKMSDAEIAAVLDGAAPGSVIPYDCRDTADRAAAIMSRRIAKNDEMVGYG